MHTLSESGPQDALSVFRCRANTELQECDQKLSMKPLQFRVHS